MARPYVPRRGDVVWVSFSPQAGHEQAGRRHALAVSPGSYNRKAGLALFCPITNQVRGYPFEVEIPAGLGVGGVILSDQIKSLDWRNRKAEFACKVPESVVLEVLENLITLLSPTET